MRGAQAPAPPQSPWLLEVEDLRVSFSTRNGTVDALRGISFALEASQTLGIVGESGSGKTTLLRGLRADALRRGIAVGWDRCP